MKTALCEFLEIDCVGNEQDTEQDTATSPTICVIRSKRIKQEEEEERAKKKALKTQILASKHQFSDTFGLIDPFIV